MEFNMQVRLLFSLSISFLMIVSLLGTFDESIGNNEFLIAVGDNDSLKVKQMLSDNIDLDYKNKHGLSAIRISVENELHNITQILEKFGAIYDDSSKFISAIYANDLAIIEKLLQKGVNPNIRIFKQAFRDLFYDWSIDYPILMATRTQNTQLLKLLIKYKADVNISNTETALMIAADLGNITIAEILLNNGANINETVDFADGSNSGSALINAVDNNNIEFARFLLDNEADTEIGLYNNGAYSSHTPLSLAVQNNNFEAVKLLIDFSADVNNKDVHGSSILDCAKQYASKDIIEYIVKRGAK